MNHIPSPPMDIFYVTYPKDHQWFRLSLACLKKDLYEQARLAGVLATEHDAMLMNHARSN